MVEQTIIDKNDYIEETEVSYKDSVIRMVENIYRADSFLSIGGATENLDYDIDSFFQAMSAEPHALNVLLTKAENFFDNRTSYFNEIPDIWPVEKHPLNRITSFFGKRFDPFTLKFLGDHKGIDIDSYTGAPVLATADGYVKDHWIYHKQFGRSIRIKHEHSFMTFYGHMSKVIVHEGEWVKKGQIVGYLGSTGLATGPHVHYEVIRDGVKVDPKDYLRNTIIEVAMK